MDREEATEALIQCIERAIAEHGRPNTFTAKELWSQYNYPSYSWVCKLGREQVLAGRLIDYKRGKFICHEGGA
jgi:hypothetical protein